MRRLLRPLPFIEKPIKPLTMYCDNKSAMFTAKNKRYTGKSKHIAVKYNHIRRLVKKGKLVLEYLPTQVMLADPLTKPLSGERIWKTSREMGLLPA